MELRFIPKEHQDVMHDDGENALPQEYIDSLFSEFDEYGGDRELKVIDYAAGADYVWVHVILTGVMSVLALGEQINSGLEGWAKIAKKILNLVKNTKEIALGKEAITALCIYEILKQDKKVSVIKKVIEYEIETPTFYGNGPEISAFTKKADIYYVQGYEIDSELFVLFGATITGQIEVLKRTKIANYR